MEIRLRSAVSRTAKGYSVEATLDMGGQVGEIETAGGTVAEQTEMVDALSAFQIAKLREHMAALGTAFPREEGEKS